jgi:hypothetical protein
MKAAQNLAETVKTEIKKSTWSRDICLQAAVGLLPARKPGALC